MEDWNGRPVQRFASKAGVFALAVVVGILLAACSSADNEEIARAERMKEDSLSAAKTQGGPQIVSILGVAWGASHAEVLAKFPQGRLIESEEPGRTNILVLRETVFDQPATVMFTFDRGYGLISGLVHIARPEPGTYEAVRQAVQDRYPKLRSGIRWGALQWQDAVNGASISVDTTVAGVRQLAVVISGPSAPAAERALESRKERAQEQEDARRAAKEEAMRRDGASRL